MSNTFNIINDNYYKDTTTKSFFGEASGYIKFSSEEGFECAKSISNTKSKSELDYIMYRLYAMICFEVYCLLGGKICEADIDMICTQVAIEVMKNIYDFIDNDKSKYEYNRRKYIKNRTTYREMDYRNKINRPTTDEELRKEYSHLSDIEIDNIINESKKHPRFTKKHDVVTIEELLFTDVCVADDIFKKSEDYYFKRAMILSTINYISSMDRSPKKILFFIYKLLIIQESGNRTGGNKETQQLLEGITVRSALNSLPRDIEIMFNYIGQNRLSNWEINYLLGDLPKKLTFHNRTGSTYDDIIHFNTEVKTLDRSACMMKKQIRNDYHLIVEHAEAILDKIYRLNNFSEAI